MRARPRAVLQAGAAAVALGLTATACAPGDDAGSGRAATGETAPESITESTAVPVTVPQIASTPDEEVPSAIDWAGDERHPEPLIDPDDLRSGGPPPDGIPAVDEPTFLPTDEVDFLSDEEPVLSLEVEGETRAYPVQVMIWHEIANDTVGDVPVAVTYCPLCNSAIAYDRRLGDRILDFGTSGMLYNSALVMYDRQTESLWSHFTGEAVIGFLAGEQLDVFPMSTVSWADWRDAHPDGLVLSRETGHDRDYGVNPYPGYDEIGNNPFLFDGEIDDRLPAMERVIGLEADDDAVAVRLEEVTEAGVVEVDLDGRSVVVWLEPGTSSALDGGEVDTGRDVGASGVFRPRAGDRDLTFSRTDEGFVDDQTGSTWNIFGEAVDGPLEGERLQAVTHLDTFWFAWAAAFEGETRIIPDEE